MNENLDTRFECSRKETAAMNTAALRQNFLIENMMVPGKLMLTATMHDRMIAGTAAPVENELGLSNPSELRADYFLERREIGIINLGGEGEIIADGKTFYLQKLDCLYLGKGIKSVLFKSVAPAAHAKFYFLSAPAHTTFETSLCKKENASPVHLGASESGNVRTIYKYIHLNGIRSCQLVMGLTFLEAGSVWNSVPPHTHTRRTEIYFYFDLHRESRVFHFMGEPQETRHLLVKNEEAVISPPWSVHFGCGTSNYGFVWGMAGENLAFDDMDAAPVNTLM